MTHMPTDPVPTSLASPAECPVNKAPGGRWLKRVGAAVFLFYLVKGLAWLVVFAVGGGAAWRALGL